MENNVSRDDSKTCHCEFIDCDLRFKRREERRLVFDAWFVQDFDLSFDHSDDWHLWYCDWFNVEVHIIRYWLCILVINMSQTCYIKIWGVQELLHCQDSISSERHLIKYCWVSITSRNVDDSVQGSVCSNCWVIESENTIWVHECNTTSHSKIINKSTVIAFNDWWELSIKHSS